MNQHRKAKAKRTIEFTIDRNLKKEAPTLVKTEEEIELEELQSPKLIEDNEKDAAFLDELFARAFQAISKHIQKPEETNIVDLNGANVGIDLFANGTFTTRMAYAPSVKRLDDTIKEKPPVYVETHIGNIGCFDNFRQFQLLLESTFKCFGKRYNELNNEEKNVTGGTENAGFQIVERNQFPAIQFDESHSYTIERVMSKYFQYMLK